ncbi:MAG TPA: CPBP family intramembrane glutamic endopeptidase [Burkholderiaceae bacterium]|nr:CPBP family intramembrane glutamic endopeptidase [Burkholderiaceae bacterium]
MSRLPRSALACRGRGRKEAGGVRTRDSAGAAVLCIKNDGNRSFAELLFRGLILQGFLRRYRPAVSLFASALLFGLAHGNVHQFLVAFPLGLANGWLVWRTRSL